MWDRSRTGELEPTGRDGPSRRDLVSALKQPMKNSLVFINLSCLPQPHLSFKIPICCLQFHGANFEAHHGFSRRGIDALPTVQRK